MFNSHSSKTFVQIFKTEVKIYVENHKLRIYFQEAVAITRFAEFSKQCELHT